MTIQKDSSNFRPTALQKALAIVEVILVTFLVVPLLTLGIYRLFPGFEAWQTGAVGFPFPVFVYIVMVVVPLALMLARRVRLVDFGLDFRNLRYHLDIALTCFFPVALSFLPLAMGADHKAWDGALILSAVNIVLLLALAWLLRKKPTVGAAGVLGVGIFFLPAIHLAASSTAGKAVVLFLTFAVFVGFGEEFLYRGYMQSRLNEVFGRPYRFFGVPYGWGLIITSFLFGLTHVGILRWILGLNMEVTLAWGFWTMFGGLVNGFVREKSGSILAPALLHGLPQAIAEVAMLFVVV